MQAKTKRQKQLAIVHILKKELALDDVIYTDILNAHGVNSAGELTEQGLNGLIKHLNTLARPGSKKQTKRASNKPKVPKERQRMINKIHALLTAKGKHEGKYVAWSYAASILKKLHGVDNLTFATPAQLHDVIAAMEYDARRGGYAYTPGVVPGNGRQISKENALCQ